MENNITQTSPDEKNNWVGTLYTSVISTVVLVAVCCGLYPLLVWGIAQGVFPAKANGSLLTREGTLTSSEDKAVGSLWMGQNFSQPGYFHPRPSAAGNGYDPTSSGGTNLGPTSDKLLNGIHGSKKADGSPDPASDFDGIKDLAAAYRLENNLAADAPVPADAVTRSGSGLDPQISPANARLQAQRVARARAVNVGIVNEAIDAATQNPDLGVFGESAVNVLLLNLALDQHHPVPSTQPAK